MTKSIADRLKALVDTSYNSDPMLLVYVHEIAVKEEALIVLRDRLFHSSTFAAAVGQDEQDSMHEDASEVVFGNFLAIRATDSMDMTDRSHERWEIEAARRLTTLAGEEK